MCLGGACGNSLSLRVKKLFVAKKLSTKTAKTDPTRA